MEPDTYTVTNTARPFTALRAWITLVNKSVARVARTAGVSEGTVQKALGGAVGTFKLSKPSATMLSSQTGLSLDVLTAGELRRSWTLIFAADGGVTIGEECRGCLAPQLHCFCDPPDSKLEFEEA